MPSSYYIVERVSGENFSKREMSDFYRSVWGIPVAGATLSVCAFFLLGVYGGNIFLIVATIILRIGHIGIH